MNQQYYWQQREAYHRRRAMRNRAGHFLLGAIMGLFLVIGFAGMIISAG